MLDPATRRPSTTAVAVVGSFLKKNEKDNLWRMGAECAIKIWVFLWRTWVFLWRMVGVRHRKKISGETSVAHPPCATES